MTRQSPGLRIVKDGIELRSVEDWRRHAGPKRLNQWSSGRSAKECAEAWCGTGLPAVPDEILRLLESHPHTHLSTIEEATPEHRVRFDRLRGEPRNTDMVAQAKGPAGIIAISIEAKADEHFDRTVAEVLAEAVDWRAHGKRTGLPKRVEQLAAAVLPIPGTGRPSLGNLRYQLLTATAGALAYADLIGASKAVLIIHEFITPKTNDQLHAGNAADLDLFVERLSGGSVKNVVPESLAGPFVVPGKPLFEQPTTLYIGKAVRPLR